MYIQLIIEEFIVDEACNGHVKLVLVLLMQKDLISKYIECDIVNDGIVFVNIKNDMVNTQYMR